VKTNHPRTRQTAREQPSRYNRTEYGLSDPDVGSLLPAQRIDSRLGTTNRATSTRIAIWKWSNLTPKNP